MTAWLVILARSTVAGSGKSRLRRDLPDDAVDMLAVTFLADTVEWAERTNAPLLIAHSGPAAQLPATTAKLVPQVEGDLGDRIDAALAHAFERGADRAVLIGSDSPDLPETLLAACFDELDAAPVTLVPATDGGWIAIGTRSPLNGCLSRVAWSARDTCDQTIAALTAAGRAPKVLDQWYDVDDVQSLRRLGAALTIAPGRAPRTAAALQQLRP